MDVARRVSCSDWLVVPTAQSRRLAWSVTVCLSLVTGCAGSAKWGMVDLPPSLAGLVQDAPTERSGVWLDVATAVRVSSSGVTAIPFRLDDARQIVMRAHAVGPFKPTRDSADIEVLVDTGAPAVLSLS